MSDIIIPVTYPGHTAYSLAFRQGDTGLSVRRSWAGSKWKPVMDVVGVPSAEDPDDIDVTINGDLRQGMPFYVHMDAASFQHVRNLVHEAGDAAGPADTGSR